MRHSGSYFGLTSGTGIPTVLTTVHRIPSTSSRTCCDKGVSGSKNWILSQPPSRSTTSFTSLFRLNGLNRKYEITSKKWEDSFPTATVTTCWKIISLFPANYPLGNSPQRDFPNVRLFYTRHYKHPKPPIQHLRHLQNRPNVPTTLPQHNKNSPANTATKFSSRRLRLIPLAFLGIPVEQNRPAHCCKTRN